MAAKKTTAPAAPAKARKPRTSKPKAAPAAESVSAEAMSSPAVAIPPIANLAPRQALFVQEYLVDLNATQAAIRAGYSAKTAQEQASRLLSNVMVQAAIGDAMEARVERVQIDQDEVVRRWHNIVTVDVNLLVEHRRVCCRCCWGEDFKYQETPYELLVRKQKYDLAVQRAEEAGKALPDWDDTRVLGYQRNREPNSACPECCGEGRGEVFMRDTRSLPPEVRDLYAGAKQGKDGIEILTRSREKADEMLGRHLGLFKDQTEVTITNFDPKLLEERFGSVMATARRRQSEVEAERGLTRDE